jgi:hypothetical protein
VRGPLGRCEYKGGVVPTRRRCSVLGLLPPPAWGMKGLVTRWMQVGLWTDVELATAVKTGLYGEELRGIQTVDMAFRLVRKISVCRLNPKSQDKYCIHADDSFHKNIRFQDYSITVLWALHPLKEFLLRLWGAGQASGPFLTCLWIEPSANSLHWLHWLSCIYWVLRLIT